MQLSDILSLLPRSQNAADWVKLDALENNGSNVSLCVKDVSLTIGFSVTWNNGKPYARYTLAYDATLLFWFDLPLSGTSELNADLAPTVGSLVERLANVTQGNV